MNVSLQKENLAHQQNTTRYTLKSHTLLEALEQRLESDKDFLIFMDAKNNEKKISARDVKRGAITVSQYLVNKGLQKDDKVIIMLQTGENFAYVFYGILMAGGIPVPVSQPAGTSNIEKYLNNLKHIIHDSEAAFFITYEKIGMIAGSLMSMPKLRHGFIFDSEIFENPVDDREHRELPEIGPDDFALFQYTSGTTSSPKGVMLTHENLLHNIHGMGAAGGFTSDDVGISWLPIYHDMGLIGGFLTCLYWNFPTVIMLPEVFIFRPQWWLENISRYGVTLGVAPNFGYHYCVTRIADEHLKKIDLSSWKLALNGAEPIDRNTLSRFIEKFKKHGLRDDIFFPVYGMAENSLAATFPSLDNKTVAGRFDRSKMENDHVAADTDSDDPSEYIDLVSVGYPLVGQEIRIADEEGNTLREREIGEILVKSNSLTKGYYNNKKATDEAIMDGWLRSGDYGFVLDGMLYISGRKKEMIIRRGKNIYPYDVERIASQVKGVRMGCCAAFAVQNEDQGTDDLVLVCESKIQNTEKLEGLRRTIQNEILSKLGFSPDDIRVVPKGTIPKTTSGKIQRILCKKIYLEDNFTDRWHINLFVLFKTFIISHINLFQKRLNR